MTSRVYKADLRVVAENRESLEVQVLAKRMELKDINPHRADSPTALKIHEIFLSIQGESTWSGLPTVFIRTSGCHLRCTYCDTTHAYDEGRKMTVEQILSRAMEYEAHHVCVTGGEPLLQPAVYGLMSRLCDAGRLVSLETSGDIYCQQVDPRVKKVIDIKTPDSGAFKRFDERNLTFADSRSEFKFVIGSEKDFAWAQEFSTKNKLFEKSNVLFSPSFESVSPRWLAEKILATRSPARLQLQLHKYIWSPNARGV